MSLDTTVSESWSAQHIWSGVLTDVTTGTNEDFCIVPNGTGKVGIGTTSPTGKLGTTLTTSSATAGTDIGHAIVVTDTGVVTSGTDTATGLDVTVARTLATGGTIDTRGIKVAVTGDTSTGATTATGMLVSVSGANTNYSGIFTGGNFGIGTTSPTAQLDVTASSASATGATEVGSRIAMTDSGAVSSGTDTTIGLDLALSRTGAGGGTISSTGLNITVTGDSGGTSTATGLAVSVTSADKNIAATFSGGSVGVGDTTAVTSSNVPSGSLIVGSGTLCVDDGGTNCDDSSRTSGTIYAVNTTVASVDLAEEFPIEVGDIITAGDVLAIDSHEGDKCTRFADGAEGSKSCTEWTKGIIPFVTKAQVGVTPGKRLLGVVSTKPGIVLGGFGQEELVAYQRVPVALAGRVPVRISREAGDVEIGDRLTMSSVAGVARRAVEGEATFGIALEPTSSSTASDAKILVLLK